MTDDKKRYSIFISSTIRDLRPQRNYIVQKLASLGIMPLGFEFSISPGHDNNWETISNEISSSSALVLIIGDRCGEYIDTKNKISFTKREFDYAKELGKPVIVFSFKGADRSEAYAALRIKKETQTKRNVLKKFVSSIDDRRIHGWKTDPGFKKIVDKHLRPWINENVSQANTFLVPNDGAYVEKIKSDNKKLETEVEHLHNKISCINFLLNQTVRFFVKKEKPQLQVRTKLQTLLADLKDVPSTELFIQYLVEHHFFPHTKEEDLRCFFAYPTELDSKKAPLEYLIAISSTTSSGLKVGTLVSQESNVHASVELQRVHYVKDVVNTKDKDAKTQKMIRNQKVDNEETVWAMPIKLNGELLGVLGFSGRKALMFEQPVFNENGRLLDEFEWVGNVLDLGLDLMIGDVVSVKGLHAQFAKIISHSSN